MRSALTQAVSGLVVKNDYVHAGLQRTASGQLPDLGLFVTPKQHPFALSLSKGYDRLSPNGECREL